MADHIYVSVFTEYKRQYDPVVCGSHLAVRTMIAVECFSFPSRDIRGAPVKGFCFSREVGGFMFYIVRANGSAGRNSVHGFAYENTVHHDLLIWLHVFFNKLVL